MVNGLGSYIQSQFMTTSTGQGSQSGKYNIVYRMLKFREARTIALHL